MRYAETGPVHMDFHRATNGTIGFLRENYGREVLDETFRRLGRDVYRSIHDDLAGGDPSQLLEHWQHFFQREGGDFVIERQGDEARLTVRRCPAIAYLEKRGIAVDPGFCRQTIVTNEALAEGTPFEVATEVLGGGRCVQTLRRRT